MQSLGLPWQELLPEARLEEILKEEMSYRNCVYTPSVTLWAMVSQVFDPDKSLSNAERADHQLVSGGWSRVSIAGHWSRSAKLVNVYRRRSCNA